ncbi:MAG: hypothetical protein QNJ34_19070 [Xenococcaceae cyanobacterium MO_188.B29]|nr:hypothetical protein [Xenococcaceae cyanobacterium MO_188.B29]
MFLKFFALSLLSFLVVYIFRGLGILGFLPGGFILFLLLTTIVSGLAWGIQKTRRF